MEETNVIDIKDDIKAEPETKAEQSTGPVMVTDEVLEKLPIGKFLNKQELEDKSVSATIYGLAKNRFGRYMLIADIEEERVQLNISNTNYNELITKLGPRLKEWDGKTVTITGVHFDGDPEREISPGTQLKIT